MIKVTNVSKTYGKKAAASTVLDDVSFSIDSGKSIAIIGKSGSGKSTLMHIMSGLDHPSKGTVTIGDDDIFAMKQKRIDKFRSQKIGFIFQSFFISGNESCYDNVSLPLEIAGVPRGQRKAKIEAALKAVELGEKSKQKAKDLSGGQKQRLAIARAIVNEPTILFADEPTGNLDSTTGDTVEKLLFYYAKEHDATLVVVTHDHDLAKQCDQQISIRDGKIVSITEKSTAKIVNEKGAKR